MVRLGFLPARLVVEKEVRTKSHSWCCVTPGTWCVAVLGEKQVDETPQAQANGANSHRQGRTGFHKQRWCCQEYTSQHFPMTQTQSAEQPLDCSYRSFNIPPLIGFKMVVSSYSSKWDLLVWIPLCSEAARILSSWSRPLSYCIKQNIFQRLLFLKHKVADTTVLYEDPNHMGVF